MFNLLFITFVNSVSLILIRLNRFTKGTETHYRLLRRNKVGELGFRVNYEGVVVELKPDGCAAASGLKQSSRLVEVGCEFFYFWETQGS